jgi:hypothetical protein
MLPKHPHITQPSIKKQAKTTTVQDTPKWNSHNSFKYRQYVTLCTWYFRPKELHRNSLHFTIFSLNFFRMKSDWGKSYRVHQNTHSVFSNFFRKLCVYEIIWKYSARRATGDYIIQRMHIACWIIKVTDTHSEYRILAAFPQQQWLHERA